MIVRLYITHSETDQAFVKELPTNTLGAPLVLPRIGETVTCGGWLGDVELVKYDFDEDGNPSMINIVASGK